MTQFNTVSSINFKATNNGVNYNKRYIPPMPENNQDDMFLMQAMEQQKAVKKEKSKERWYKAGVLAQVGMAVAFLGMLGTSLVGLKKGGATGASRNLKLEWKNIAKDTNFPKLEDDCVNPKVREFISTMKKSAGLSEKAAKAAGVKRPEQCILMYGPSGTGKTFSAKMLAKEIGAEYTEVQFADVSSPYIGQTSVEIQNVFKQIKNQAEKNPDKKFLVGFNEIDALLVPREKCGANSLHLAENRTAFLNGLDDIANLKNIKIVGTTNVYPESGNLDKASLSRFKNMIEVQLPTEKELKASLKFHLRDSESVSKQKFFENNEAEIDKFVTKLHENKYSQRDVEDLADKARNEFANVLENSKDIDAEKFKLKYLDKAFDLKGPTTGSISSEPVVAVAPPPTSLPMSTQKMSLIERLKALFGKS